MKDPVSSALTTVMIFGVIIAFLYGPVGLLITTAGLITAVFVYEHRRSGSGVSPRRRSPTTEDIEQYYRDHPEVRKSLPSIPDLHAHLAGLMSECQTTTR
jgi:hypothetical protein